MGRWYLVKTVLLSIVLYSRSRVVPLLYPPYSGGKSVPTSNVILFISTQYLLGLLLT